jgi:acyl carrier protein
VSRPRPPERFATPIPIPARSGKEDIVDVSERIKTFIRQEVLLDTDAPLEDDTSLLDGVLDSLALMQLVGFLEEEFETEIDDGEVTAENFKTVADIEHLVNAQLARA